MATEDRRLINRIRSGDKGAFEELVKRHYEDVFSAFKMGPTGGQFIL